MGTRSRIAIKVGNKYRSIYCHWDGYPEGVGEILKRYYKTKQKVLKLIALGDISSLGPKIGRKHSFSPYEEKMSYEEWAKKYGEMTTAYRRDRGETGTSAETSNSLFDLKLLTSKTGGEYLYVFDKGKWTYFVI